MVSNDRLAVDIWKKIKRKETYTLSKSKASLSISSSIRAFYDPPFSLKGSITLWLYANFYHAFHYKPTYTGTVQNLIFGLLKIDFGYRLLFHKRTVEHSLLEILFFLVSLIPHQAVSLLSQRPLHFLC